MPSCALAVGPVAARKEAPVGVLRPAWSRSSGHDHIVIAGRATADGLEAGEGRCLPPGSE